MPRTAHSGKQLNCYQLYVQREMLLWRQANPHLSHTEGMHDIGQQWRDTPENPNRGNSPIRKNRKTKKSNKKKTKTAAN
ncbi:hypothetical protein C8F01DRAFT_1150148 [Mycena amicta]|nr:hypothetical protein C8F01DRAFT_1150148 [Mycena amicta]